MHTLWVTNARMDAIPCMQAIEMFYKHTWLRCQLLCYWRYNWPISYPCRLNLCAKFVHICYAVQLSNHLFLKISNWIGQVIDSDHAYTHVLNTLHCGAFESLVYTLSL